MKEIENLKRDKKELSRNIDKAKEEVKIDVTNHVNRLRKENRGWILRPTFEDEQEECKEDVKEVIKVMEVKEKLQRLLRGKKEYDHLWSQGMELPCMKKERKRKI